MGTPDKLELKPKLPDYCKLKIKPTEYINHHAVIEIGTPLDVSPENVDEAYLTSQIPVKKVCWRCIGLRHCKPQYGAEIQQNFFGNLKVQPVIILFEDPNPPELPVYQELTRERFLDAPIVGGTPEEIHAVKNEIGDWVNRQLENI